MDYCNDLAHRVNGQRCYCGLANIQNADVGYLAANQLAGQRITAAQQYAALQDASAGQALWFNGWPENAKAVMGRGPCEVCSAGDEVLYCTSARATDGSRASLQTCWDCWEAIKAT